MACVVHMENFKSLISVPVEGRRLGACIREAMQGGFALLPQRAVDADVLVQVRIIKACYIDERPAEILAVEAFYLDV